MMTPSAPMTKNTLRQPNSCAIQPINGANNTVAKYCPELKKAEAVPRSLPGNQAATMRALAGNEGAPPRPNQERHAEKQEDARPPAKKAVAPRPHRKNRRLQKS